LLKNIGKVVPLSRWFVTIPADFAKNSDSKPKAPGILESE